MAEEGQLRSALARRRGRGQQQGFHHCAEEVGLQHRGLRASTKPLGSMGISSGSDTVEVLECLYNNEMPVLPPGNGEHPNYQHGDDLPTLLYRISEHILCGFPPQRPEK